MSRQAVLVVAEPFRNYPQATEAIRAMLTGELAWAFWGFAILGVLLPVIMELQRRAEALAAVLVLLGGFLLRYFIVYAGQVGVLRF